MLILIGVLLGIFVILGLTPVDEIFKDHRIKKISREILGVSNSKEKANDYEASLLNKVSKFGMIILKAFNVKWSPQKKIRMHALLIKGGQKVRFTADSFLGLKVGMLILGGGYGLVLSYVTPSVVLKVICYSTSVLCYLWPELWLKRAIKERQIGIIKEMPFVLSSIAIVTESGQSIMQSIQEVSSVRKGPLSEEFKTTMLEIQMGYSRIEAFENMMDRVQVTELSIFLSGLNQSIEKGGSGITRLLKKQSDEMWKKRKENAKKLAEQASIKLFIPLLLFVLPAMMIFLLTPALISLFEMM